MELILINGSKLKIMMTCEDMAKYDLKCEDIDYDSTHTRRAFWSILDEAKQKTGFDAASDKVFVQLYPSKGGGCEMYITKLGASDKSRNDKKVLALGEPAGKVMRIYSFERFAWLAKVCAELYTVGYKGESSAYYDPVRNMYYLMMSEGIGGTGELSFIGEFGRSENFQNARLYLKEYCRCVCAFDAVKRLSDM